MLSWLSRIAGPKVLLGVALAGAVGMGALWWLYSSAAEDAARAGQQAAQLRQDLTDQRQANRRLERERDRLEASLSAAREDARAARQRADDTRADLQGLEESDDEVREWARDRVPGAVAERLREYARARDEDGGGEGQAPE